MASLVPGDSSSDRFLSIEDWREEAVSHGAHGAADDTGIGAQLCSEGLTFYRRCLGQISEQGCVPKPTLTKLTRNYEALALWAQSYNIAQGGLDEVLASSRLIRRLYLKALSSVCTTLLTRLLPLYPSLEISEAAGLLRRKLEDGLQWLEDTYQDDGSVGSRSDTSSAVAEDGIDEICRDLEVDIDCLLDLDPLLASPVLDRDPEKPPETALTGWSPHLAICERITNRFPKAGENLVQRLGKATWESFLRCKALRDNKAAPAPTQPLDSEPSQQPALPPPTVATTLRSKDSALGSSLPTISYAETVMSYRRRDGESVKVPPLSNDALNGEPFECLVCNKQVVAKTNAAWKIHLFADLRPYVCLLESCFRNGEPFVNREAWVNHYCQEMVKGGRPFGVDVGGHYTCPLCSEYWVFASGTAHYSTSHLASHLEEISLGTLALHADFESESGSDSDGVCSDADEPHSRGLQRAAIPDFRDTQMPDIFKAAYPDFYDKHKYPLYASCHTEHRNISTLVWHISRAPHKLDVSERYISSFGVEGTAFSHVGVGICRRCWGTYTDRNDFDRHISRMCGKISKGKRDKWQVLYDAFTPIADHGATPLGYDDAQGATDVRDKGPVNTQDQPPPMLSEYLCEHCGSTDSSHEFRCSSRDLLARCQECLSVGAHEENCPLSRLDSALQRQIGRVQEMMEDAKNHHDQIESLSKTFTYLISESRPTSNPDYVALKETVKILDSEIRSLSSYVKNHREGLSYLKRSLAELESKLGKLLRMEAHSFDRDVEFDSQVADMKRAIEWNEGELKEAFEKGSELAGSIEKFRTGSQMLREEQQKLKKLEERDMDIEIQHQYLDLAQIAVAEELEELGKRPLDSEHVKILELQFSRNQKPSITIKRELAEQMGHDVARINNWFQDRRAKEKSNPRPAQYAATVSKKRYSVETAPQSGRAVPSEVVQERLQLQDPPPPSLEKNREPEAAIDDRTATLDLGRSDFLFVDLLFKDAKRTFGATGRLSRNITPAAEPPEKKYTVLDEDGYMVTRTAHDSNIGRARSISPKGAVVDYDPEGEADIRLFPRKSKPEAGNEQTENKLEARSPSELEEFPSKLEEFSSEFRDVAKYFRESSAFRDMERRELLEQTERRQNNLRRPSGLDLSRPEGATNKEQERDPVSSVVPSARRESKDEAEDDEHREFFCNVKGCSSSAVVFSWEDLVIHNEEVHIRRIRSKSRKKKNRRTARASAGVGRAEDEAELDEFKAPSGT